MGIDTIVAMSPLRLLVWLGLPLGLAVVLLLPPWTGYDEFSHYARAVDIANGSLLPKDNAQGVGSLIPGSYAEGTEHVIRNYQMGRNPTNWSHIRELLGLRPDGTKVFVDTRATSASTPVAYLPAVAGMAIPVAAKASGIGVLWAGRLSSLVAYLAIVGFAVQGATRFRWSLTIAALLPINLTLASSLSPDGLTISALLLTISMWIRVQDEDPPSLPVLIGSCVLLAVAKPPYFLVLAAFPALLIKGRNMSRVKGAYVAAGGLALGALSSLLNSLQNYRAVTFSLIGSSEFQPKAQMGRLIRDIPDFLIGATGIWFREIEGYVSEWFRQLGSWESGIPSGLGWTLLGLLGVAAILLDSVDYLEFRGFSRALAGLGVAGMVLVLYGSSYVYFSDRSDYQGIGIQMARYSSPLFALFLLGWMPRWFVHCMAKLGERASRVAVETIAVGLVVLVVIGTFSFSIVTWLVTGDEIPFG